MTDEICRSKRLLIDSGAVDRLAGEDKQSAADIRRLKKEGYWPPVIPAAVLAECVSGDQHKDFRANRFIQTCHVLEKLSERDARRAGELRTKAQRGSVVDAILVAIAEPGGVVLTDDLNDLEALATNAQDVTVVSTKPSRRNKKFSKSKRT
ncbi:MAG: hypothetical protein OXH78_01285 [Acidimicrobiaceae bacterium]|nr:hypothetical protein [Acidimicrobiaceae bacterium]